MIQRRHILPWAVLTLPGPLWAQPQFPSKALRIVVPFGAGGVADLSARVVAQALAERLQQPVLIDNRPGAGGVVAGEMVARAEADGHTLLLMSNATAVSAGLFKNLPFNPRRDFAPVGLIGTFDMAVVVPETSPHGSLAELIAWGRAHPGRMNIATIQVGSTQHLAAELLRQQANLIAQIVPYNGTPAVLQALRGKQVDMAVEILGPLKPQLSAGALRLLGVMGEQRPKNMPKIPTVRELPGLSNFAVTSWNALAAPAHTPRSTLERLNSALVSALREPETMQRLANLEVTAQAGSPAQLAQLLDQDIARWSDVMARAGIGPH